MLYNPKMPLFLKFVPFHILVVDEASQISTQKYLALINQRSSSLRRMIFIGDDQQCMSCVHTVLLSDCLAVPPFGDGETQSIFEVTHLRPTAFLLNTQCELSPMSTLTADISSDRMPPQIGDFISSSVYKGELQSNPLHPITSAVVACHFVDVADGKAIPRGEKTSYLVSTSSVAIHALRLCRTRKNVPSLSRWPHCSRRTTSHTASLHPMTHSVTTWRKHLKWLTLTGLISKFLPCTSLAWSDAQAGCIMWTPSKVLSCLQTYTSDPIRFCRE
jgi:hypothetical protein